MLTLDKKQEKQLRSLLKNFIKEFGYYGYQIKSEGAHGERVYLKKLNPYTNEFYFIPYLTTTQLKYLI